MRAALAEAAPHVSGLVLLGAELKISANAGQQIARANIDWPAVRAARGAVSLALRVSPTLSGFAPGSAAEVALHELTRSLLEAARAAGVPLVELQLDFDAPQKQLATYRAWLHRLRLAFPSQRLVITTLPAWLEEPELPRLLREVDGYVLQVHSVPVSDATGRAVLCDPDHARAWVARAAKLGRPFSVALPTYWCTAGYGAKGELLGIAMDAVQPAWPAGTRTLALRAEPVSLAALVREWQTQRPPTLREIIWYRVPVSTDLRNWPWPTLAAVMAGRTPLPHLEPVAEGENPVEISLLNRGEADAVTSPPLVVHPLGEHPGGTPPRPVATDALGGWSVEMQGANIIFKPGAEIRWRLRPGEKRPIGWIRFATPTPVVFVGPSSLTAQP